MNYTCPWCRGVTPSAKTSPASLALALLLADDSMAAIEEYFEDRAEADVSGTPAEWMPNEEMRRLEGAKSVRATIERALAAMGEKA